MNRFLGAAFFIFSVTLGGFFIPQEVIALSIDLNVGQTIGFATADLLTVTIRILQWILGLLALIAVIIVIWGGIVWMTAGGNREKLEKAKKILINGLIGLVIILLAWAIVLFVMRVLGDATGGGGGGGGGEPPGGGNFPGADFEIAAVEASRDNTGNVYQCSKIKTRFNANVDPSSIQATVQDPTNPLVTQDLSVNQPFGGTFGVLGISLMFSPGGDLTANTQFEERYPKKPSPILDTSNPKRVVERCQTGVGCTNGASSDDPLVWPFTVGNQKDTVAPSLKSSYPVLPDGPNYPDRNISLAPVLTFTFDEPIDDTTIMVADQTNPNKIRPITGNFTLEELDNQNGNVVGTISNTLLLATSINNGFNVWIEDPVLNPFKPFTWYRITIQNVQDLCGNIMNPHPAPYEFQTNNAVPGVQSWYPTGINECPSVDVVTTFSTTMYYQKVTIRIDDGQGDGRTATLEPSKFSQFPIEITIPGSGVFKIMDTPQNFSDPPNNVYRVFEFSPNPSWKTNATYTVTVTTDLKIDIQGNTLSKQWTFTTSDPTKCTCSPYATTLNPQTGPMESCLTVQGKCFTGTNVNPAQPSKIVFDDGQQKIEGVIGGSGSNYVTTTLPSNYGQGSRPWPVVDITYQNTSYGTLSSQSPGPSFFVNSSQTSSGPCLWSLNPTSGYVGDGVGLSGIRFGSSQGSGSVNFTSANATQYPQWTDTAIQTSVPNNAIDGNVTVSDNQQQQSNGILFDVQTISPGTPYIIRDSFCSQTQFSSPSPWFNQTNICLEAQVSARFNESMKASTLNTATIQVQPCSDSSCSSLGDALSGTVQILSSMNSNDTFLFDPQQDFGSNQWYFVTVTTGVQNTQGVSMASPFTWKFQTQNGSASCPISWITVSPPGPKTINWGGSQSYQASPQGPGCQVLDPGKYSWGWNSTNPNVADLQSQNGNLATAQSSNVAEGSTWIEASAQSQKGKSELRVDLTNCQADPTLCSRVCLGSQCKNGQCTPVINNFSPTAGPVGQYVTISGCMFGSPGQVDFLGGNPPSTTVTANSPTACSPGTTWTNSSITVEVPDDNTPTPPYLDASDGPIQVTSDQKLSDDTTDLSPNLFNVSGGNALNLCPLSPSRGPNGIPFTATGEGFGAQAGSVEFWDGEFYTKALVTDWKQTTIQGTVPGGAVTSIPPRGVYVQGGPETNIRTGGNQSNQQPFTVTCSANSQCSSGCCYQSSCASPLYCQTGNPGQQCQIPNHPDPSCQSGSLNFPGGYGCISDAGDSYFPPNPPTIQPTPGQDCRVCCQPGQTLNTLTCLNNQGVCTGSVRGLYCGCTNDAQCGDPANVGCGQFGQNACCSIRPKVSSTQPADQSTGICLNAAISVTFDQLMNGSTFNASNVTVDEENKGQCQEVLLDDGKWKRWFGKRASASHPTCSMQGTFSFMDLDINSDGMPDATTMFFYPSLKFTSTAKVTITIKGDSNTSDSAPSGVLSRNAIGMNGDYKFEFTTGTKPCQISQVDVSVNPPGAVQMFDLFTCVNGKPTCPDDLDVSRVGTQHQYTALAKDANGNVLTVDTYQWQDGNKPSDALIVEPDTAGNQSAFISTKGVTTGQEYISVTVTDSEAGSVSTMVTATVNECQNPWPSTSPYYYLDSKTNFLTYYCKDGNPLLPDSSTVTKDNTPSQKGVDELIREIFFEPQGTSDVVGIRIMENEGFLSPRAWFDKMFPNQAGSGSATTADGYQALQVGRTTYVAATNLSGSTLYPNIYLISYNDTAGSQTVAINNEMLKNWFFNTNVTGTCGTEPAKQCIIRDTKRVTDLGEIAFEIQNYKQVNGNYPALSSGSYLPGLSTSKWPSWISGLGNELGRTPPTDPKNIFDNPSANCPTSSDNPPGTFDPGGTCWDAVNKKYFCPVNSSIYQYITPNGGQNAGFYANLEYGGTGSWQNFSGDPCTILSPNSCSCFNYEVTDAKNFIPAPQGL